MEIEEGDEEEDGKSGSQSMIEEDQEPVYKVINNVTFLVEEI